MTMWKKTLHFLGLVEDYEDEYADLEPEGQQPRPQVRQPEPQPPPPVAPRPGPSNVRPIPPAGQQGAAGQHQGNASQRPPTLQAVPGGQPGGHSQPVSRGVHVTNPTTFNEVEEVGERFRQEVPVIMNLQGASEAVAKRLLDFASGLIYGLDGRIERVGDRVFLLTPRGVDVSTEERARLSERGFFNQA